MYSDRFSYVSVDLLIMGLPVYGWTRRQLPVRVVCKNILLGTGVRGGKKGQGGKERDIKKELMKMKPPFIFHELL